MTLVQTIEAVERLAASLGRDDIVDTVRSALRHLERDILTVTVVGDFKQGKTSLVNGLLGRPLLPVDADFATAVPTLLRAGAAGATVHRSTGGESRSDPATIDDIDSWISERGNPGNRESVDLVEITLDSPLLAAGVALVDTPGMGALTSAHREATLHFLTTADALVLVSDAASPLTRPEIEFLGAAATSVPFALVTLSRIDLHPEWRRMIDETETTIQQEGLRLPVLGVSSFLREAALRERDTTLNEESGFPALLAHLSDFKIHRTELVGRRVATEISKALEILAIGLATPGGADPTVALEQARQRQRALASAAGRIPGTLQDAFTDLRSDTEYATRSALRAFSQTADARIDEVDPASDWSDIIETAMTALTADLRGVLEEIDRRAADTAERLAALLGDESGLTGAFNGDGGHPDVPMPGVEGPHFERPSLLSTGLQTLRGAQSGLILLGMVAKLSGLAALLPVSLGVGLVFGVKQLGEERKRQLERRRQEARKTLRVLVAEVSAEATRLVQDRIRDRHRMVRDQLQELAVSLQRSTAAAVQLAERRVALAESQQPLDQDPAELLDELRRRLREAAE